MITLKKRKGYDINGGIVSICEFYGVPGDTKPTEGVDNGSVYTDMVTGKKFYFNGITQNWIPENLTKYVSSYAQSGLATTYYEGAELSTTGVTGTVTYSDSTTASKAPTGVFPTHKLLPTDTKAYVYYDEDGVRASAEVTITVTALAVSSIAVTTAPTKTSYDVGEALDLTGVKITATYNDGSTEVVTDKCTFSPTNGTVLASSNNKVTVSYKFREDTVTVDQSITVTPVAVESIAVTTAPTTVSYEVGDALDLTGMVITATYDDASTAVVTTDCTFLPANGATLAATDTKVTATYTYKEVSKTVDQAITVTEPEE